MRVVIVDDSVTSLMVAAAQARALPSVEVVSFQDASAALSHLENNSADLIITDYLMPELDGLTLLSRVRELPRHTNTPMLMVTSDQTSQLRSQAVEQGANGLLNKPYDGVEFKLQVGALLFN